MAAASTLSLRWASTTISNKLSLHQKAGNNNNNVKCSRESEESRITKRRTVLLGAAALTATLFPTTPLLAQERPMRYETFVDPIDGYSYYYPSDWRDFDCLGHDSAFKDRYMQLQNVRVRFIPTEKKDIHDLGPMEEVINDLVTKIYAAPNQYTYIGSVEERSEDGKNYYTFEYTLASRNFTASHFATIAIANGRYYTLIVGANERRWKKYRNSLKVVADSFKVLDI